MTRNSHHSPGALKKRELPLERLLGRRVLGKNNQPVGCLEEFRAVERGTGITVSAYVIGAAGLLERLGVGMRLLLGRRPGGQIARADQIDITDPDRPRLTCDMSELEKF